LLILPFFDFIQFGLGWPVWLAAAGVLVMLLLLVAILRARRPQASGLLVRTLMRESTLHGRLLFGFRLVAAVPILTLLPLLAVISTTTVRDAQLPQIERLAASIATSVPRLVEGRVSGIDSLAGHIMAAGHADELALSEALLRHQAANQEFASLWVARSNGDVVAASAIKAGKAALWAGPVAGLAMMDSFKRAVLADELYVSPVKKGAAADEAPMVFVSAPIILNGDAHWGFIQGLLNLQLVANGLVTQGTIDSVSAIITDQRNRVILASPGLALSPFSDLSGHPLMTAAATVATGKKYNFSGIVNNDGDAANYVAVSRPLDNGWHVFAAATQAKADITVLVYMVLGLIWALLALMLARGIAPIYGEVVAQPLQKLEESLEIFDAARTITIIPPAPNDAPQEIRQTYARVRESMQNSRDAYRNMLKVVKEGTELRKELGKIREYGNDETGKFEQPVAVELPSGPPDLELAQEVSSPQESWLGRLDSVTELAGREVFEGFFGEAWMLGVTDSRPISLVLLRINKTDEHLLKLIAQKLKTTAGRTLDLAARISEWEFGLVLPDTDLNGTLAVVNRMRGDLQSEISEQVEINYGAASIVPNANGNAKSFLDMCQRALLAAHQKGDGQVVFINEKGKLALLPRDDLINWDPGEEASA
jgi:GGDEF domain-containing protein